MSNEVWEKSDALKPLLEFRKSLLALEDHLKSLSVDAEQQVVIDALVLMHAIKSEIGYIFNEYQMRIVDSLPSTEVQASNGQRVEKKIANDRKAWQHDRLAEEVLRRLNEMSVDMDTGEVVMSSQQIAMKLFDYVAPSYWRVKELSKLGINADQYCEVGELKTNIAIRKVD